MGLRWVCGLGVLAACNFDATGLSFVGTDSLTAVDPTTGSSGDAPPLTSTTEPADDTLFTGSSTTVAVTVTEPTSTTEPTPDPTTEPAPDPTTEPDTGTSTGTSTGDEATGTSTGDETTTGTSTGDGTTTGTSTGDGTTGTSTGDGTTTGTSTGEPVDECADGLQGGEETDVDCGGPVCAGCADGLACVVGGDCVSGVCDELVCAAPTCDDGAVNGGESDVDCGGADCTGCADGLACEVDADCAGGLCGPGVCVADLCEDLAQDGEETGIDCGGACEPCEAPVINEVDYDQEGADIHEFVELFNPTTKPIALAGMQLVLVNGVTDAPYATIELGPAGVLPAGGFLVVRTAALPVPPGALSLVFALPSGNIQNGTPDGIALVDTVHGVLADALSYEGAITAATVPPLGVVSLVEGNALVDEDVDAVPGALARLPSGADSDDALTDWHFTATPTPGAPNVP